MSRLRGVVLHWTGGGHRANAVDLEAYHFVVEVDGRVVPGRHPIEANMRQLAPGDRYAAHTGGWNSYRVGIAAAGMLGYTSRSSVGRYPLAAIQVAKMCELAGRILVDNDLDPMDPLRLCSHREVWTIHGIRGIQNHQKRDIEFLPFAPSVEPDDVGTYLRRLARLFVTEWPEARLSRLMRLRHPPHLEPVGGR